MANDKSTTDYEEARKQRVLENKKRFEDLGIMNISKSLSDLTKSEKKTKERHARPKAYEAYMAEPRRSSRARNPVPSYRDDIDVELPRFRQRSDFSSSWASYLARPVEEIKTASYKERARALECAEKLQSNLQSGKPSFVKSMLRSHVYSCFWLGLPNWFCEDHLPKSTVDMVLEDEEGSEYEAVYIGKRTGLSGGWRAFALDHKLDDGDALVFELIEPTRFKVYTVRASHCSSQDDDDKPPSKRMRSDAEETATEVERRKKAYDSQSKGSTNSKKEKPMRASARLQRTQGTSHCSSQDDDDTPPPKIVGSDAEETATEVRKRKKKNDSQSKDSTNAKTEKPVRASARLQRTRGK